jgi:protoporphyrinogen oxidase
MPATERIPVVVLGAGPAGLGAAWRLARRGCFQVTVVERNNVVGGNAGSFELEGLRVDYGSHRLHPSCEPQILADLREMLGDDLVARTRHGRIRLRGRWVHFPLRPLDLAASLPPSFLAGVAWDAATKFVRADGDESFAAVLERGLGRTICRDFYFPYARKIWGVPPEELDAEQARRRVSANSLARMLKKVLPAAVVSNGRGAGRCFFYPKHGYGEISEAYCEAARKAGATIKLRTAVSAIDVSGGRAVAVWMESEVGRERLATRWILSTIPLPQLVRSITPAPPPAVLESASALRFRAMLLVYLVLATDRFTEYDAHYFPGPEIAITRLSEPKNYGLAELPGATVLCAELPCSAEDSIWRASDGELKALVLRSLAQAGLPSEVPVRRVVTRRLQQAYPIYTCDYAEHFGRLDEWVSGIEGLLTFGRQGLFAHDNTHHALAMAYAASDCVDSQGRIDRQRWASCRQAFREHVVED